MALGLLDPDEPGSGTVIRLEAAGPWRRAAGRLADTLLADVAVAAGTAAAFLTAAIGAGLLGRATVHAAVERLSTQFAAVVLPRTFSLDGLTGVLALLAMHTLCEGLHGSTPGKRIVGVTVRSVDGGPATIGAGLSRSLGFLVDQIALGLVGFLRMRRSPQFQRFGDEWADTVVVRLRGVPPEHRRFGRRFAAATR